MSAIKWKGVIRDRTEFYKSFWEGKSSTKSSSGSTKDNSREIRFKPLSSSIMKIVNDADLDLEKPKLKQHLNEREVSMNSDEPSLADEEGIDVRDRKIEADIPKTNYKPPFWVL